MNATFAEVPNADTIGEGSQAGHSARAGAQATAKAVFCMPSLVVAGRKLSQKFSADFPEVFQREPNLYPFEQ